MAWQSVIGSWTYFSLILAITNLRFARGATCSADGREKAKDRGKRIDGRTGSCSLGDANRDAVHAKAELLERVESVRAALGHRVLLGGIQVVPDPPLGVGLPRTMISPLPVSLPHLAPGFTAY